MNFEETFYGRPNTIKTYLSLFRRHINFPVSDSSIDWRSWTENSTLSMLAKWEKKGLSRNTKIALMRLLGRYVKFNGGPDIDTQKFIRGLQRSGQQTEAISLSSEQSLKLMEVTQQLEPKFYPVMLLALHAGLRRGEIFGLKCADIDLLRGEVKVCRSYDGPTKNGRSRIVKMSVELSRIMLGARNLALRGTSEWVFERFDPNPVLRRVCASAGLPKIKFHALRHTFASLALSNKVNPKQVAAWLGHSSVVTTLSIYWHLTNEEASLDFLPGE